jgi:hypothetical protein
MPGASSGYHAPQDEETAISSHATNFCAVEVINEIENVKMRIS